MRKLSILLVAGMISCWIQSVSAQSPLIITENFDGNTNTFTASPASAWKVNTNYYISSPDITWKVIPNMTGDKIKLISPKWRHTTAFFSPATRSFTSASIVALSTISNLTQGKVRSNVGFYFDGIHSDTEVSLYSIDINDTNVISIKEKAEAAENPYSKSRHNNKKRI
jgi:hypothetical protein